MIRCDRIHPTPLSLLHRGGAKPRTQLRVTNQFDDGISQSSRDAITLAGEDHAGVTISDVSGELGQITHHWDRSACHRFEWGDR